MGCSVSAGGEPKCLKLIFIVKLTIAAQITNFSTSGTDLAAGRMQCRSSPA